MDTEFEELAFFIRPLEIVKDEASVCTIIGDISLQDRSMIQWAPVVQSHIEHQVHLDSVAFPI